MSRSPEAKQAANKWFHQKNKQLAPSWPEHPQSSPTSIHAQAINRTPPWSIVRLEHSMTVFEGSYPILTMGNDVPTEVAGLIELVELHNARLPRKQQPSAPTPDVEKIIDSALDNAITALGQCQKGTARQFLHSALAQARVPLVAAAQDAHDYFSDNSIRGLTKKGVLLRLRSALTGTGEK